MVANNDSYVHNELQFELISTSAGQLRSEPLLVEHDMPSTDSLPKKLMDPEEPVLKARLSFLLRPCGVLRTQGKAALGRSLLDDILLLVRSLGFR